MRTTEHVVEVFLNGERIATVISDQLPKDATLPIPTLTTGRETTQRFSVETEARILSRASYAAASPRGLWQNPDYSRHAVSGKRAFGRVWDWCACMDEHTEQ